MKVLPYNDGVGRSDEIYVKRWNIPFEIDHPLRQDQSNKVWKNSRQRLTLRDVHQPNIGILKQRQEDRRDVWRQCEDYDVEFAIDQCLDGSRPREWQQRCAFGIDAGCSEDLESHDGLRPHRNAFALELRQVIQSLRATIKHPKYLIVDAP